MATKTPTYTADSIAELVSRLKSGEIPGSYAVQGVGTGGPITAVSPTALGKAGKEEFAAKQRLHKQNKSAQSDIAKAAKISASNQLDIAKQQDKVLKDAKDAADKQKKIEDQVKAEQFVKNFEMRAGIGQGDITKIATDPTDLSGISDLGKSVQNQQATNQKEQDKIKAREAELAKQGQSGGGGGGFDWLSPGDYIQNAKEGVGTAVGALNTVGQGIVDAGAGGLEIIGRPGSAVSAGMTALSNPDTSMSDVLGEISKALQGKSHKSWSDVIDAQQPGLSTDAQGNSVQFDKATQTWVPAKEINPWLRGTVGFAGDVLTDPTTYVGLGTAARAAQGFMAGGPARDLIDLEAQAAKAGIKKATVETAGKKTLATINKRSTEAKKAFVTAGAPVGKVAQDDLKLFNKAMQSSGGDLAAAQVVMERKLLADIGHEAQVASLDRLARENQRVLTVKFLGKPIGQAGVSKASGAARKATRVIFDNPVGAKLQRAEQTVGHALNSAFNTRYYFPGKTHDLSKIAQERGIVAHKAFERDVREQFHGLKSFERKAVADAVESGKDLSGYIAKNGKDLGEVQKFFKAMTDQMFNESRDLLGKYVDGQKANNYAFHFYRSGLIFHGNKPPTLASDTIKAWKAARKKALQANDVMALKRLTLAEAEAAGLKPLRNADEILLAHFGDHNRRLVRDDFLRSIVNNYGMVTDNHVAAHMIGMKEYKTASLTHRPIAGMRLAEGQKLYLSKEAHDVVRRTEHMMTTSNEEIRGILRGYDKAMSYWKLANTAVNPAHHVRNSMSDFFMNFMDGVTNPYRYKQSIDMFRPNARAGLKFKVGGRTITGEEMMNFYRKSGSAQGFTASEINDGVGKVIHGVHQFSQGREEWTRMAHFIDTVIKEGSKVGVKNDAGLWKVVRDAGRRVNKWNIDYTDLTPFERSGMKRVVPFYTFYRKALPLMIESLATKPGRMLGVPKGFRMLENLAGVPPAEQDQNHYPDWLVQNGFARLGGDAAGLSQGGQLTWSPGIPTQIPGQMLGGGPQGMALNALSMTNPLIKDFVQLATQRSLQTGGPLGQGTSQYTDTAAQSTLEKIFGGSSANFYQRLTGLTGAGLYDVTTANQLSQLKKEEQPYKSAISALNKKLGIYEIHQVKGGFTVYDPEQKLPIKKFTGPNAEAEAYVYGVALAKATK